MTATAAETKDVNGAGSICTAGAVLSFASSGRGCGGGGRALIPSAERAQGARRDARTAGIEELRLCLRCWRIREGRMYGHWSRPRRVPWAYGRHGGRAMGGDLCVQMCGQGRREGMRGVRDRLGRTVGVKAVRVRRCGAHAWWPIRGRARRGARAGVRGGRERRARRHSRASWMVNGVRRGCGRGRTRCARARGTWGVGKLRGPGRLEEKLRSAVRRTLAGHDACMGAWVHQRRLPKDGSWPMTGGPTADERSALRTSWSPCPAFGPLLLLTQTLSLSSSAPHPLPPHIMPSALWHSS